MPWKGVGWLAAATSKIRIRSEPHFTFMFTAIKKLNEANKIDKNTEASFRLHDDDLTMKFLTLATGFMSIFGGQNENEE